MSSNTSDIKNNVFPMLADNDEHVYYKTRCMACGIYFTVWNIQDVLRHHLPECKNDIYDRFPEDFHDTK